MEQLFREKSERIRIYIAKETIVDKYTKEKNKLFLNPIPIDAIVTDLTVSQAQYKIIGIKTDKAKQIIVENKYRSILELSHKIEIDGEFYSGWKVGGKLQIRKVDKYLRVYIYLKKD